MPKGSQTNWQPVSGWQLLNEDINDLLQEVPAIYSWKLSLLTFSAPYDTDGLLHLARRIATASQGSVKDIRVNHSMQISAVELRGGGLGERKEADLRAFLSENSQNRRWFRRYLQDLEPRLPSLYCGETGDLRSRVKQHMSGATDFGQLVEESPHFEWNSLNLFWYPLGGSEPSEECVPARKALEHLTTILTISPLTQRIG